MAEGDGRGREAREKKEEGETCLSPPRTDPPPASKGFPHSNQAHFDFVKLLEAYCIIVGWTDSSETPVNNVEKTLLHRHHDDEMLFSQ